MSHRPYKTTQAWFTNADKKIFMWVGHSRCKELLTIVCSPMVLQGINICHDGTEYSLTLSDSRLHCLSWLSMGIAGMSTGTNSGQDWM